MEHCPLTWRERGRLWMRLGIRAALVIAVVLLVVHGLPPLFSLLAPFVFALIVAWLFNPLVRWLQRKLSMSRKVLWKAVYPAALRVPAVLMKPHEYHQRSAQSGNSRHLHSIPGAVSVPLMRGTAR